jgi:hypothetical protein
MLMVVHRANHKWKSAFGSTGNRWQNWADAISPSSRALSTGSYFDAIQTKTGFSQPIEVRIRDAAEEDSWLDVRPVWSMWVVNTV